MPNFAEFVAESFHSHTNLVWDHPRRALATAAFGVEGVVEGTKVVVSFEQQEATGPWYVVFEVDLSDCTAMVHSAFEIFNGVFQAVEEFVEVREPEAVVLATKRDKLAGIYQTYLKKESATLERLGYKLEGQERIDPYVEFTLRRMKPSGWKE